VALVACSTVVHLTLAERATSAEARTLLVVMGAACLACVPSLWRGGSLHSWMTMLGLSGAMLFAHLELCFACGPMVHDASDLNVGMATQLFGQGLASLALWLMVAEMAVAVTAVFGLPARSTPHRINQPEVAQP
jgi:hypothetical protein